MPVLGSQQQQCPKSTLRLNRSALLEELPHNCLIPVLSSPRQRCLAIWILRLNYSALLKELPHNCLIPLLRRIWQRRPPAPVFNQ